ncbi:hypothetical protein HQ535_06405 [bacterium]|nr:hypothetical protein [bacterium]
MKRVRNLLLAMGVTASLLLMPAAMAQENTDQLLEFVQQFVPAEFVDVNGDGLPDLADLEEGQPGIWDDSVGAKTPEEFLARIDTGTTPFDLDEKGSMLEGPCGGVAISWDADGNSIDAFIDRGDGSPPIDVVTGGQALTATNPFKASTAGTIGYFGFTHDVPSLSTAGNQAGVNYGDSAPAFHDHQWELIIMEISADFGGDPNQRDKNRNAGLVELGEELPFDFRAKVKARGAIIDLYGSERLPDFDKDNIAQIAGTAEYCFGEGWVEFVGDGFPLFTAPGALAAALALAGFSGILFNARPAQSWRS